MGPIVCATRGGEASRRTQERAIALAKERGAELIFLCVFDPGLAGEHNEALAAALKDERRWLGRAVLGIARSRARNQGLHAEAVVLYGPVLETIVSYLRRVEAATLVLGRPKVDSALTAFRPDNVRSFAEQVSKDTGVEVVVVTPED